MAKYSKEPRNEEGASSCFHLLLPSITRTHPRIRFDDDEYLDADGNFLFYFFIKKILNSVFGMF